MRLLRKVASKGVAPGVQQRLMVSMFPGAMCRGTTATKWRENQSLEKMDSGKLETFISV